MNSSPATGRKNPFDNDAPDTPDFVASTYDAAVNQAVSVFEDQTTDVSADGRRFSGSLLDDFFNEPLINAGVTSTVQELEDAILQCKHMYWATANSDPSKRRKLVDRLVGLRRILFICKESSAFRGGLTPCDAERGKTNSIIIPASPVSQMVEESVGFNQFTVPSGPSTRLPRHQSDNDLERCGTISPIGVYRGLYCSTSASKGGHDLRILLSIRCLGRYCEQCCRPIVDPSSRTLYCTVCHIICHAAKKCSTTLRRRCPASFSSANFNPTNFQTAFLDLDGTCFQTSSRIQPARRRRSESESCSNNSVQSVKLSSSANSSLRNKSLCQLEVCRLHYVTANLQAQRWVCYECDAPLDTLICAPASVEFDSAYKYVTQPRKALSILEMGICNMLKQAAGNWAQNNPHDESRKNSTNVITVGPRLLPHGSPLPNQVRDLLQTNPVFSTPNVDSKSSLAWALSTNSPPTYLGPIQTRGDACVLEAVNRMNSAGYRKLATSLALDHNRERSAGDPVDTSDPATRAPRLCYYTGHYYCYRCHWNDVSVIPSRIFLLGKNDPKPVCRSATLWLAYSWSRRIFRVPDAWYRHEASARRAFSLRLRLFRVKPYVDRCEQARNALNKCAPDEPHWLFEQPYTFTMQLVEFVLNGILIDRLTRYLHAVHEHVSTCATCESAVPNCCAVCRKGPIHAYEPRCAVCNKCWHTCHRSCLSKPLPDSLPIRFIGENPHLSLQNLSEQDLSDWIEVLYPVINAQCGLCRPPDCDRA